MNIPDAVSFAQLNEAMENAAVPAPPEPSRDWCDNTATIKDVVDIAQKLLAEADEHGENMVHKVLMMLILNRFEDVVNGAANTARERSNFDTADSMDIDARTISQARDILWKTRMANNDWLANQ
jgi:hypothetical protein